MPRLGPIAIVCSILMLAACGEATTKQPSNEGVSKYAPALELAQKKDFDAAIKAFDALIEKSPSDAYAYRLRGNVFNQKGELDRALADFNKSIELEPKDEVTLRIRGDTYLSKDNFEKAMVDYASAMEINPKYALAYSGRANAYLSQGKPDHALADFFHAIELSKKDDLWWVQIAALAFSKSKDPARAIAILSRAMEADPLNGRWFAIRAEQFAKQMRFDQEMADYYRAIELSKKDGLWWLSEAVKSISDRNDLDHAKAILARAMEVDPLNARWVLLRAELYSKQSRFDLANADYTRALELDASQGVLEITVVADRLFEKKTYDPGISLLTRALEVKPDDTDLLLARTKFYRANGQAKAAESDASRVVVLCSGLLQSKPSDVNAYFNRASAYAFKESWEQVIADAKHGLSLLTTAQELEEKGSNLDAISSAHDAKQFQLVATWYKELADQVQKLEVAETGKAGKETAAAFGSLSYHLLFVKQFKEALAAADQALALTPDRKWISVNRAHALLFLGRGDEAKSLYSALWKERLSEYSPPLGDSILDDFNELEKVGLSHPEISEIKALHPAASL